MAEIRSAQARDLVDEDGDRVELALAPGLSADAIDALAGELGVPLPADLRALLGFAGAVAGPLDAIDFTGRAFDVELAELLPHGLPVAGDGYGNFWALDLGPAADVPAPVFFHCHDPPLLLYQSPDIAHFLREAFRLLEPPHASLVDDVHEDRLHRVWRDAPGVIGHAAALVGDVELRAFADGLDERWQFADLREPAIGMGFAWGRHGPLTELRRHGHVPLFAFAPPPRRPGLLERLRGRR